MKLYMIMNNWRGERYINYEYDTETILSFTSVARAKEHIEWEIEGFTDAEKETWRSRLEVIEIEVPDVRGIDP